MRRKTSSPASNAPPRAHPIPTPATAPSDNLDPLTPEFVGAEDLLEAEDEVVIVDGDGVIPEVLAETDVPPEFEVEVVDPVVVGVATPVGVVADGDVPVIVAGGHQ